MKTKHSRNAFHEKHAKKWSVSGLEKSQRQQGQWKVAQTPSACIICNNAVICYSAANDGCHCAALDIYTSNHGELAPRCCILILSYLLGQTVAFPTHLCYIIYANFQESHQKDNQQAQWSSVPSWITKALIVLSHVLVLRPIFIPETSKLCLLFPNTCFHLASSFNINPAVFSIIVSKQ